MRYSDCANRRKLTSWRIFCIMSCDVVAAKLMWV